MINDDNVMTVFGANGECQHFCLNKYQNVSNRLTIDLNVGLKSNIVRPLANIQSLVPFQNVLCLICCSYSFILS